MRVLFVASHVPGTSLPMVPPAQAVRHAGHEVFGAAPRDALPVFTGAGGPAVGISATGLADFHQDRRGLDAAPPPEPGPARDLAVGRVLGRAAADSLGPLTELIADWRPDLVVWQAQALAAPLAAHRAGVPHVRFETGFAEPAAHTLAAVMELGPELEELGLYELPDPVLALTLAPASLRDGIVPEPEPLRHIPYDPQVPLRRWMYEPSALPRILVAVQGPAEPGSLADPAAPVLRALVDELAGRSTGLPEPREAAGPSAAPEPAEITVIAADLPDGTGAVRAETAPFATLAATAALVVHQGRPDEVLTCLAAGVPQLIVPATPEARERSAPLRALGAARTVAPGADGGFGGAAAAAARTLLEDSAGREAARRLRHEIAAMPAPADLVARLVAAAERKGAGV